MTFGNFLEKYLRGKLFFAKLILLQCYFSQFEGLYGLLILKRLKCHFPQNEVTSKFIFYARLSSEAANGGVL